jgi:hypothetical protein
VIYSNNDRFLPTTHQRYQAAENWKTSRCVSMKEWKEMWVQSNGEDVIGMSVVAHLLQVSSTFAANLPRLCRDFAASLQQVCHDFAACLL